MDKLPYELESYIAERQQNAAEANNADFKATYQPELDEIEKRCVRLYKAGLALIQTIPPEDLERCRKLYVYHTGKKHEYQYNALQELVIDEKRVLVPAYVGRITELRNLQKILA